MLYIAFLYIAWCLKNAPKKLWYIILHRSGTYMYTTEYYTLITCSTQSFANSMQHYNYVNKWSSGIFVKAVLFTKLAEQCGSLSDPVVLWLWGGELDRHHEVCRVTCVHERWRNGLKNVAQVVSYDGSNVSAWKRVQLNIRKKAFLTSFIHSKYWYF